MAARFKPSYRGIGQMLCADFMIAEMDRRAHRVLAAAQSFAPVDEDLDDEHRGRYKASFKVTSGIRPGGGGRKRRAFGRVTNDAPEALDVEYGNRNTPRHRVLGRALMAARD